MQEPIELSALSRADVLKALGEAVSISLKRSGAAVFLRRKSGEITILDPSILDHVPEEQMAIVLLEPWDEVEVLAFLEQRDRRRNDG